MSDEVFYYNVSYRSIDRMWLHTGKTVSDVNEAEEIAKERSYRLNTFTIVIDAAGRLRARYFNGERLALT